MTIRNEYRIGERVKFKDGNDIFFVNKIFYDWRNVKILQLMREDYGRSVNLEFDMNVVKITDKDPDSTQIRLNTLLMMWLL